MRPHPPRARGAAVVVAAVFVAGLAAAAAPPDAGQLAPAPPAPSLQVAALLRGQLPIVAEHRYRIAGKVRPLLLFWIGKDNVGGARVRWRRGGQDELGYDLLIGSDPARAPRQVNRWGFIMEEATAAGTTVLGVMKKSDEETLDEATSHVAAESAGGVVFKMIQASVDRTESVAHVTTVSVPRDYSYRELDVLMERLVKETGAARTRKVAVPAGGRTGLLVSLGELIRDGVRTVQATSKAPGKKTLSYAYYSKQYELSRVSSSIQKNAVYGGTTYPRLLESSFEIKARGESWTESFSVVSGVDGQLSEIPVFMTYQPRWWFKVELVLDERERF
jgi:hypothetical protein